MENEGTISETEIVSETGLDLQNQQAKISKLAVASMVFGILGPFCFGTMCIVSFLSFQDLIKVSPYPMTFFSCGVAWIVGLILGIKSLRQIENSQGQLGGKGYAVAGITISMAWVLLIFGGLVLPALFYVNS